MTYEGKAPYVSPENDPYADPTERLVQEHLAEHLELLGLGHLTFIGLEVVVPGIGRIDILARLDDELVVIEVKRDAARREAVGQLQSYMGQALTLFSYATARGVLVAAGIDAATASALKVASRITFVDYRRWHPRPDLRDSDCRFPNGWNQIPMSWLGRRMKLESARLVTAQDEFKRLSTVMEGSDELREFQARHPFGGDSGIALVRANRVIACVLTDYGIV